jgi:uncharacterized membrane protein YcaP (DUF421 family)
MYLEIIFKTIFLYFFVIVIYRIMGKKELGQLSIIDLIVSILIAELVAISIEGKESILISVMPIIALMIMQIIISYLTIKFDKFRHLIEGKPTIIIKNGKLNFTEMSKIRYSLDDLIMQLRLQGVKSIEKVKYAILENNGNLSVFLDDSNYPLPIIMDSVIDFQVLKEIHKDINWLNKILTEENITIQDVFYAFYTNKKLFIIKRDELI